MNKQIADHFLEAREMLSQFIENEDNIKSIERAGALMVASLKQNGKILSCGNGGSMCDAMHFAEELTGRFRDHRSAIGAIAIADPSHLSCVSNDYGYEYVFSRYVEGVGRKGDILLGISTSGNSQNVVNAVEAAQKIGMKTVVLTGKNGGKLKDIADVEIRAPHSKYADRAQEIHIKVIHSLIHYIEHTIES